MPRSTWSDRLPSSAAALTGFWRGEWLGSILGGWMSLVPRLGCEGRSDLATHGVHAGRCLVALDGSVFGAGCAEGSPRSRLGGVARGGGYRQDFRESPLGGIVDLDGSRRRRLRNISEG